MQNQFTTIEQKNKTLFKQNNDQKKKNHYYYYQFFLSIFFNISCVIF